MKCTCCNKPLTGGSDTFGPVTTPMCQACHFELLSKPTEPRTLHTISVNEEGRMVYGIEFRERGK